MKRPIHLGILLGLLALLAGCGRVHLPEVTAIPFRPSPTPTVQEEPSVQEFAARLFDAGDPVLLWGREQLDPAARTAYDRICDAIACYQETLADIQVDQTQVEQILAAIRIDHPEFFWFDGEASFVSTELSGMPVQTSCTLTYTLDRDQISLAGQQIQQYAAACLSSPGVASAQSDYEKIIGVYRYLIENTDYVITEPDQSILSVMRDHEGTCAGYARSFQYLMNYLGIPCTMALGYGASGESHGWNMVQCGGQWYQMDVTWGDPVTPEGQPGTSLQYTYCMVTDQEIYRDHTLDSPIPMPACTATEYNYFIQSGRQFAFWDPAAYEAAMAEALENGERWFSVRFSDEIGYRTALTDLVDGGRLASLFASLGVTADRVTYSQNDSFREISVLLSQEIPVTKEPST